MIARLETLRLWRSRRPLLALFAVLFFLSAMLLGFYTYAMKQTGGRADFRYTFENASYFNGLTFAIYAFYFGFLLVLPIFAATEGGTQIAGDTASGTMRLFLTRPLARARLFFTKLAIATGFTTILVAALLLLAMFIGLFAVGWGDLNLYPGVLQLAERHEELPRAEAVGRFALAWPLASVALFVPLALSLLVASFVRGPVNAVGTSVAVYLVLYVISQVHFFQDLRPWLFTSYMAYWRGVFREEIEWSVIVSDGAKLVGWGLLFAGVAFHRFRRREEG